MMSKKYTPTLSKRVLAIDPGFDRLGLAVLEQENGEDTLLYSECFKTNKKDAPEIRLKDIGQKIKSVIKEWGPENLAIETLFFNQNISSAIGVAEARGVVLYEASCAGLAVREYAPQSIKIAVTGYGKADKKQVESMVLKLISIKPKDKKIIDDEMDAIALGITHLASSRGI